MADEIGSTPLGSEAGPIAAGLPVPGGVAARPRVGVLAFWVAMAGFAAASVALARVNNAPGSSDSCSNLLLARNLVLGRGYVSTAVGDLWIARPIPFGETTRPPGLPWLLAAIFALTGVSLAVPVLLNAAAVAANALFLRGALARSGCPAMGDLAGLLILLSYDYEMVSIWNNNILAACHSAFLMLAAGAGPGRGRRWTWVALAACSAFGFLMKPTFILGALPFSILVLGSVGEKTRSRRLVEIAAFLALFSAITATYWGRNLLLYGEAMHAPSFSSSRLAIRYGVLGDDPWRVVRFGRPMTYGEVARSLGLANLLIVDAKMMAKTVLYSILMNPAVAACTAGLVLFWRPDRWRDYAGAGLLMAGVVFEVGVYNHHEFRYLWPLYPCMLYLAGLAVRDFAAWGVGEMTPRLAGRARLLLAALGASALLVGGFGAVIGWQSGFRTARQPAPAWRAALGRLPDSAVVLGPDVASITWWTDRKAVICPSGSRGDLATVVALFHVDHYLAVDDAERPGRGVAFQPADLTPIDRGEGWRLYRLRGPLLAGRPEEPR